MPETKGVSLENIMALFERTIFVVGASSNADEKTSAIN